MHEHAFHPDNGGSIIAGMGAGASWNCALAKGISKRFYDK
jgi:hypothetical protein